MVYITYISELIYIIYITNMAYNENFGNEWKNMHNPTVMNIW